MVNVFQKYYNEENYLRMIDRWVSEKLVRFVVFCWLIKEGMKSGSVEFE